MPIAARGGIAAGVAAMVLAGTVASAAAAPQPSPETVLKHIEKQFAVMEAVEAYEQATYMMMMYHRCPDQFALPPEKKAFVQTLFSQRGQALRDAMTQAHQRLTQKLPSDAMYVRLAQRIKAQQEHAANTLARLIETHKMKCRQPYLERLDAYVHALQAVIATNASSTTTTPSNP